MEGNKILLIADVVKQTKLSSVSVWRGINEGWFPPPDLIIGKSRRSWLSSTITNYLNDLIAKQKTVNNERASNAGL